MKYINRPIMQDTFIGELRCLIAETLMGWALQILPVDSPNAYHYAKRLCQYFEDTSEESK
jgi:hypothetical protein